jgi:hypothetical protein
MTSIVQMDVLAPLATPLPEGPAEKPFTDAQWTTLMAIMDTVIPSIRRQTTTADSLSQLTVSDVEYNATVQHLKETVVDAPDSESLDVYLNEKPSDIPEFQELLSRLLVFYGREDARKGLGVILSALK